MMEHVHIHVPMQRETRDLYSMFRFLRASDSSFLRFHSYSFSCFSSSQHPCEKNAFLARHILVPIQLQGMHLQLPLLSKTEMAITLLLHHMDVENQVLVKKQPQNATNTSSFTPPPPLFGPQNAQEPVSFWLQRDPPYYMTQGSSHSKRFQPTHPPKSDFE